MKIKIAGSIALVSILTFSQSALAIDFQDLLRGYLGVQSGTNTANAPAAPALQQPAIKENINIRQAQLESELQAGVTSGQITAEEEAELRAELNKVADLEGQYLSDGVLNHLEVTALLNNLTAFSTKLQTYMTNASTRGVAGGLYGDSWFRKYVGRNNSDQNASNQTLLKANIDTMQSTISGRIEEGITSGRLDWSQAREFRNELNRIASDETRFLANGFLSYRESRALIDDLNALDARVNTSLTASRGYRGRHRGWDRHHRGWDNRYGTNVSVDSRQSLLRQRIDRGVSSGRLTRREADRLYADEQRIVDLEAQLRASGNRLTFSENRRLLTQLDDFSRKINQELNDKQVQ